jgi:hypothetical protein
MKLVIQEQKTNGVVAKSSTTTTYQPDDELREVVHYLVRCLQSLTLTAERIVKVIERETKGD